MRTKITLMIGLIRVKRGRCAGCQEVLSSDSAGKLCGSCRYAKRQQKAYNEELDVVEFMQRNRRDFFFLQD